MPILFCFFLFDNTDFEDGPFYHAHILFHTVSCVKVLLCVIIVFPHDMQSIVVSLGKACIPDAKTNASKAFYSVMV